MTQRDHFAEFFTAVRGELAPILQPYGFSLEFRGPHGHEASAVFTKDGFRITVHFERPESVWLTLTTTQNGRAIVTGLHTLLESRVPGEYERLETLPTNTPTDLRRAMRALVEAVAQHRPDLLNRPES